MAISITMQFQNEEKLVLDTYDTINVSRKNQQLDINITNAKMDLALNNMYNRISELQGQDKSFSIVIVQGESEAPFDNIVADYYNSGDTEILHLSTRYTVQS